MFSFVFSFFVERLVVSVSAALPYKIRCQVINYKCHNYKFHYSNLHIIVFNTVSFVFLFFTFVSPLLQDCNMTFKTVCQYFRHVRTFKHAQVYKHFHTIFTERLNKRICHFSWYSSKMWSCIRSVPNVLQMLEKFFGKGSFTFLSFLILLCIIKAPLHKIWLFSPFLTGKRAGDGIDQKGTLFSLWLNSLKWSRSVSFLQNVRPFNF